MTDDKKHDDKDRKKLSDEELEDVAGGVDEGAHVDGGLFYDTYDTASGGGKDKRATDPHNSSRSNKG